MADLADNVRLGDDAGQHFIGTAHDHEIGMEVTQEFRRVDEWSIVADGDEPLACCR